jgi:hypothetical protein
LFVFEAYGALSYEETTKKNISAAATNRYFPLLHTHYCIDPEKMQHKFAANPYRLKEGGHRDG